MNNTIRSIQDKLKNYSKKHKKTHQFTLIRYFQERLLYRLSKSKYRTQFYLKGGALVYSIQKENSRPTIDIDLLANDFQPDEKNLKKIFTEICSIEFPDGVDFDLAGIKTSEIIKEGNYSGIRIKIGATLGNIKQTMQIDIGFGDVVTPGPVEMHYPTLIDMESPALLAYSTESLLAEKFNAMIDLAEYNSRMKDFYDLYTIFTSHTYNTEILREAIKNTFNKRNTNFIEKHPLFEDRFVKDEKRLTQWKAFLGKTKLDPSPEFKEVMALIIEVTKPLYESLKK